MIPQQPRIGIVGLGMVGQPIRVWFERKGYRQGFDLFCFDVDSRKACRDDVNQADIVFVSVPTPARISSGACDTSMVSSTMQHIEKGKIVVIKSTVVPGTTFRLQQEYPEHHIFCNPEFLTEATAERDFLEPDRQILGYVISNDERRNVLLRNYAGTLFRLLPSGAQCQQLLLEATEAEVVKYFCNVFGFVKVTLAEFFANLCYGFSHIGIPADYNEVRRAVGKDPRIGPLWLDPTRGGYDGVAGYCLPKDMNALIACTDELIQSLIQAHQCTEMGAALDLLYKGRDLLIAIRNLNNFTIALQGLHIAEMSMHAATLDLSSHYPIRKDAEYCYNKSHETRVVAFSQ